MRLLMLLALCLFVRLSWAQEDADPYDMFGNPVDAIKVISVEEKEHADEAELKYVFLACDDKRLLDGLSSVTSADKKILDGESIIAYRHRILAQKHITNFSSLPLNKFNVIESLQLAEVLISEKIKKSLQDKDFAICVSDNPILKRKVYLLQQYNADGNILVYVIGYSVDKIHQFICKK